MVWTSHSSILIGLTGSSCFAARFLRTVCGHSQHRAVPSPFCFDAAPHLRPGEANTVAVRVLNRLGMGGVYLPAYLVTADRELDGALIRALLEKGEG